MSRQKTLVECIQKVATGQEYSRDVSRDDARLSMEYILSGDVDEVQAAVFLIALRMKRETSDENLGLQDAINAALKVVSVDVDHLCTVSDPYDGLVRSIPVSVFLPATLAACGLPTVSHGVDSIGPKQGVTHAQVLSALGYATDMTPELIASRIENPEIGWGYLGLQQFHPALFGLKNLRERLIKRTALSTLDRLHRPLCAKTSNTLVTGYVHKAYPDIYLELARNAGFDRAITYRGYEGGLIPALHQAVEMHGYLDQHEVYQSTFDPSKYGISGQIERAASMDQVIDQVQKSGMSALQGSRNAAYQSLVVAASLALTGSGMELQPGLAVDRVRSVLDSGAVLARFERALSD